VATKYPAEAVLKEYQNRIYRLALSISRNEKDAEDILQDTLIKIYRNLKYFQSRSKLSTWIYRIAYNESLMYLRKKRRLFRSANAYKNYNERLPAGLTVNWSKLPDRELLDAELKQRIDSAIRHIPIRYRMPLLLHRIEGLSLQEGSRILGLSNSALKSRLHRSYLMVKDEITDYFKDREEKALVSESRCGAWTGFIARYALGKLDQHKQSSFRKHIDDCPSCNLFLDAYLKAIRITGVLECQDIPSELKRKVETFIRSEAKK
jgi:RNA polymerase sigma-70 factor, ECF subfamily